MPPSTTSLFPDINVWLALPRFRALARRRQPATKEWADAFLAAFAAAGSLTVVTFDRGLRAKATSAILLEPAAKPSV